MQFKIYVLFFKLAIFCNESTFTIAKALMGKYVTEALEHQYNFIVSIAQTTKKKMEIQHMCTGALITHQDVLTAEHCVEGKTLKEIQIIIGNADLKLGKRYFPFWWMSYNEWVSQMVITPEYPENDILLIRLARKVSADINPVGVFQRNNSNLYGRKILVAGWSYATEGLKTIMQKTDLYVLTKSECNRNLSKNQRKDKRILCTTVKPSVSLQPGDDGGPVIFIRDIVAINVLTCPFASTSDNFVNIHISLELYKNFIKYVIEQF